MELSLAPTPVFFPFAAILVLSISAAIDSTTMQQYDFAPQLGIAIATILLSAWLFLEKNQLLRKIRRKTPLPE